MHRVHWHLELTRGVQLGWLATLRTRKYLHVFANIHIHRWQQHFGDDHFVKLNVNARRIELIASNLISNFHLPAQRLHNQEIEVALSICGQVTTTSCFETSTVNRVTFVELNIARDHCILMI